jgi:small subunit ribosomal protein S20
MPNTNQAAKRQRQNVKCKLVNRARKTAIKTHTKKVETAVAEQNVATADEAYKLVQARLDKAAKGRTIHPNKAARRKSRMQKKINAMKAAKSS